MSEPSRTAMTKADLISIVAKRLDITQVQSGIIVEAALRSIVSALQGGQEVEIRGFGSFRFRNRAPRKGRNPKTGEKVDVPPKRVVKFKVGRVMRDLVSEALTGRPAKSTADPSAGWCGPAGAPRPSAFPARLPRTRTRASGASKRSSGEPGAPRASV